MQDKKKNMSRGIVINVIALVLVRGFVIFLAPYMTDVLSSEEYGVLNIFTTWSSVITIVAGLGATAGLTNFKINNDEKSYKKYCWNSLLVGIIPHIILFTVAVLFRDTIAGLLKMDIIYPPLIVLGALFDFIISFFSSYLVIENNPIQNFLVNFFSFGFYFAFSYSFTEFTTLFAKNGELAFVLGHIIANGMISLVAILVFAVRGIGILKKEYVRYCLKLGIPIVFHALAGIVISSSDRIMLQRMSSESVAGIYAFTYTFASIISYVWSAINAIWVPYYFKLLKDKDYEQLRQRRLNFDFLYGFLFAGFILVYPEVISILASREEYLNYSSLVIIIALSFVLNHLYSFTSGYETFKEKTNFVAIGTCGAAVTNILCNALFIPKMGATGAALATLLSYVALALFHWIIAVFILQDYPLKSVKTILLWSVVIASTVIAELACGIWYIRWGVATIAGIAILIRAWKNKSVL